MEQFFPLLREKFIFAASLNVQILHHMNILLQPAICLNVQVCLRDAT
jgi:hypothetical protein